MSLKKLANMVKKENKERNKTIEERFIEALDKFLVSGDEGGSQRLAFNPSSYYKCMRMVFYKLKGIKGKKKKYPRAERILQVGTALHEWVQTQVFMRMDKDENSPIKLLPKNELPFYGQEGVEIIEEHHAPPMEIKFVDYRWTKKYPISAMVDGALSFAGKDFLFEFKTINPEDFETLIEPLLDHIKQGALYALCTGVRRVMFLYLNKADQRWKAFFVEYNQDQIDWVVARITTIEDYVLRDELPPKEVSDHCKMCPFKDLCDADKLS